MHVSGHGYKEDLKLMLTLMKPKYFIPIYGEFRMLNHHRLLAESVGVEQGNTFIINNSDVVAIAHTAECSYKITNTSWSNKRRNWRGNFIFGKNP